MKFQITVEHFFLSYHTFRNITLKYFKKFVGFFFLVARVSSLPIKKVYTGKKLYFFVFLVISNYVEFSAKNIISATGDVNAI